MEAANVTPTHRDYAPMLIGRNANCLHGCFRTRMPYFPRCLDLLIRELGGSLEPRRLQVRTCARAIAATRGSEGCQGEDRGGEGYLGAHRSVPFT